MLDNYRRGRTVVPDIACNSHIKFEHLHYHAIEKLGADFIASGHYASTSNGDFQEEGGKESGVRLLTGIDPLKDQTYFLCTLRQEQLRRAMFPVGSLTKTKVRQIAREQGLDEIADKPETKSVLLNFVVSLYLCLLHFYYLQYIEPKEGEIVTVDGKLLGEHDGIHHFTLGKRIHIQDSSEAKLECRIQRTHPPVPCKVRRMDKKLLSVRPVLPFRAVADGQTADSFQMCVFYDGRECLGGGEVQHIISTLHYN
ncbi:unnamed protein product [Strongylus vulgaris]|uniref:Uncharacterized protein n=1 Tax=Strongylus vulgaris TaxID=40348 RepID=A0A3P7KZV3_STRVU|nr:unnamed protein product [Strongylus vulgaris]